MSTLDPSAEMVAAVRTAMATPIMLLAIPAGVLADRFDRRRLLLMTRDLRLMLWGVSREFIQLVMEIPPRMIMKDAIKLYSTNWLPKRWPGMSARPVSGASGCHGDGSSSVTGRTRRPPCGWLALRAASSR